jgi:ABC-type iron transport system FetAB ATPase subunit
LQTGPFTLRSQPDAAEELLDHAVDAAFPPLKEGLPPTLMVGPSGNGKSTIVKNMAKAMGWAVIEHVAMEKETFGPRKQATFAAKVEVISP